MNKVIPILLLLFALKQSKGQGVAYISRVKLYESIPGFIQQLKSTDSLKQLYGNDIKQQRNVLQQKFQKLIGAYNPRDNENIESLKRRMQSEDTIKMYFILKEEKLIDHLAETYNQLLIDKEQKQIAPVLEKLNAVIEQYSITNQLDGVFILDDIGSNLAYYNKQRDITDELISILKKKSQK